VRISSWERKDSTGNAMLGGETSYHVPKGDAEQRDGEAPEAARAAVKRRKGKGDDGNRDEGR
jgi:hypothetical protein